VTLSSVTKALVPRFFFSEPPVCFPTRPSSSWEFFLFSSLLPRHEILFFFDLEIPPRAHPEVWLIGIHLTGGTSGPPRTLFQSYFPPFPPLNSLFVMVEIFLPGSTRSLDVATLLTASMTPPRDPPLTWPLLFCAPADRYFNGPRRPSFFLLIFWSFFQFLVLFFRYSAGIFGSLFPHLLW